MSQDTVRWGILSTAAISDALLPGLLAAEGSELAGIASRSHDKAEAAGARWGCPAYASYEALLDDPSIEAVYIPLPNHLHAEWTVKALEAGKHVLCEKPLALTVEEVDRIAEAAARTGHHVLEAFMYRHAPRWRRAVELVAAGAIGEPRVVRVGFSFLQTTDLANIRFIPEVGGGIVWDMGCYATNMARGMVGREPTEVFGFHDIRDGQPADTTVTGVMRFGPRLTAPFWVSFDFHNPYAQVEVVGSDGWLMLPGTGFRHEPHTKLLLHQGDAEIFTDGIEPNVETFPFVDPYRLEVEHLADVIRGRAPLAYDLADARANTAALLAMHASIARGGPAPIRGG